MGNLDLGVIGNCTVSALIDARGRMVWACLPRMDGDPYFCGLLDEGGETNAGTFTVALQNFVRAEQEYLRNTAILVTRLYDRDGAAVEIVDFAPRCHRFGRTFKPMMFVRRIRPLAGSPVIRVHLQPRCDWGGAIPSITFGSNHIRYVGGSLTVRVTTDAGLTALLEGLPTVLEQELTFLLGPDETVEGAAGDVGRAFLQETTTYWHRWVRYLGIPFEWQDAVIRAAITLKLSAFDDTGAIVAAMTTSIPEAPHSTRNWDYRYCWLRDSYFVVAALNRLGATGTMERYLHYIVNLAATRGRRLQPVYRISGRADMPESIAPGLRGFRGMGPVRVGNAAYQQDQNDIYGSAVLAAMHMFFDRRLVHPGDEALFRRLEPLGEIASEVYDQPDAGIWEFRGMTAVHTFSSVMCWVACDRLARIATHLALAPRAVYWREHADRMRAVICNRAYDRNRGTFVDAFEGSHLDASLLLLHELGFLAADDPRFAGTVAAIEKELKRGEFIYRYARADDLGAPEVAFVICTYWYIDALIALERRDEARALFEKLLDFRNPLGLLSEDIDPASGELWGNFPQTYSMVGLIQCALRLSRPWERAY
ncbi:MAG: Trehalase [Gammaproteobacteria bacterium]|nr:Trehalase [Gammaproteobacteria bacterium]